MKPLPERPPQHKKRNKTQDASLQTEVSGKSQLPSLMSVLLAMMGA